MTQIYTFRITYWGCEEKIWRVAEVPADELLKMIREIDRTGVSRFQYMTPYEKMIPWVYRNYDLVIDNALLKGDVNQVQFAYEERE